MENIEITVTVQAGWMFGKADSWLTDGVRPFFLCRNTPGIARNRWGGRGVNKNVYASTAYKISLPIYIVRWVTYSTKCPVCGTLHDVKENNENACWPCAVLAFFLFPLCTLTLKVSFFSWLLCRVKYRRTNEYNHQRNKEGIRNHKSFVADFEKG